jgi:DNA-binding transcriptional ArsR family regulator
MDVALHIIHSPQAAAVLLHPARLEMLDLLGEPDSAAGLARRLHVPRQQVNYHLRELEREGLIELVEERRRGNCMERRMKAKARSFIIDPKVLGNVGADPDRIADKLSSAYLIAIAAQAIRDLIALDTKARDTNKRLSTLSLHVDVRFAGAADRHAFSEELAQSIAALTAKYHNESAPGGRTFRFFLGAYPAVTPQPQSTMKAGQQ